MAPLFGSHAPFPRALSLSADIEGSDRGRGSQTSPRTVGGRLSGLHTMVQVDVFCHRCHRYFIFVFLYIFLFSFRR